MKFISLLFLFFTLIGCESNSFSLVHLTKTWKVIEINQEAILPYHETTLTFTADGRIFGHGACNKFEGTYKLNRKQLSITPTKNIMTACLDEASQQENEIISLLNTIDSIHIDKQSHLLLTYKNKVSLVLEEVPRKPHENP